ncbi:NAD(P)-dependent oxidoreductase [Amycolatopsis pigmentata]|uniref:NAD(P)-dependent oxidoreductase n=1 Tax=Amycolatopsis pigmentata TaxID=450801 RepID=A0ABW5G1L5_9PSEU
MSERVAFLGLGKMGAPMSRRLVEAGVRLAGFDPEPSARRALEEAGGETAETAAGAITGATVIVLMLPSSAVVEAVLGDEAVRAVLAPGSIVVDMSSSDPVSTRALAKKLAAGKVALVDAPVSGGVVRAKDGTLTIMTGGDPADLERVAPVLAAFGTARRAGDVGAGHALKAINNLLSAVHLLATAEGVEAGRRFGLDPEVMVSLINTSSGRSGSSENKFPNYVFPGTYDSGFTVGLMLKDIRIAASLAEEVGAPVTLGGKAVELWAQAEAALGGQADHTEIARWVQAKKDLR